MGDDELGAAQLPGRPARWLAAGTMGRRRGATIMTELGGEVLAPLPRADREPRDVYVYVCAGATRVREPCSVWENLDHHVQGIGAPGTTGM